MLIFLQFSIGTRAVVMSSRHRPFCFHNFVFLLNCLFVLYRATRISVCVIAVSKSHEFLLKVRRLFSFFSTTTPTPSRRRVVIFSTTTQGIRLRRRVDVFFPRRRHCIYTVCRFHYMCNLLFETKSIRSRSAQFHRF